MTECKWSSEEALKGKYDDGINKNDSTLTISSSFGFHMLCLNVCFPVKLKVWQSSQGGKKKCNIFHFHAANNTEHYIMEFNMTVITVVAIFSGSFSTARKKGFV